MAGGSVLACDSDGDAVDAPQSLPALRSDVRLLPVSDPLLPDWTLFDPARGKYFKVGWVEFEMLSRWSLGCPCLLKTSFYVLTPQITSINY